MQTPVLEIRQTVPGGERRWGIRLLNIERESFLESIDPLAKGDALAAAKLLRSKGADAPILKDAPTTDRPAWILRREDDKWILAFTLTDTLTDFIPSVKAGDDEKEIEEAVETIKGLLRKVEIEWNPPSADPAYDQKEEDLTPGEPLSGS